MVLSCHTHVLFLVEFACIVGIDVYLIFRRIPGPLLLRSGAMNQERSHASSTSSNTSIHVFTQLNVRAFLRSSTVDAVSLAEFNLEDFRLMSPHRCAMAAIAMVQAPHFRS